MEHPALRGRINELDFNAFSFQHCRQNSRGKGLTGLKIKTVNGAWAWAKVRFLFSLTKCGDSHTWYIYMMLAKQNLPCSSNSYKALHALSIWFIHLLVAVLCDSRRPDRGLYQCFWPGKLHWIISWWNKMATFWSDCASIVKMFILID